MRQPTNSQSWWGQPSQPTGPWWDDPQFEEHVPYTTPPPPYRVRTQPPTPFRGSWGDGARMAAPRYDPLSSARMSPPPPPMASDQEQARAYIEARGFRPGQPPPNPPAQPSMPPPPPPQFEPPTDPAALGHREFYDPVPLPPSSRPSVAPPPPAPQGGGGGGGYVPDGRRFGEIYAGDGAPFDPRTAAGQQGQWFSYDAATGGQTFISPEEAAARQAAARQAPPPPPLTPEEEERLRGGGGDRYYPRNDIPPQMFTQF